MKHQTVPRVAQLLLEGRANVELAWCQFNVLPVKGYCAVTALGHCPTFPETGPRASATRLLQAALPSGNTSVVKYNDDPATTKQDILALYDRAVAKALAL